MSIATAAVLILLFTGLSAAPAEPGYKVLRKFGNTLQSSADPVGNLIEGTNGLFYGLSRTGGVEGYGTVFQIRTNGELLVLRSFSAADNDGQFPAEGTALLLASNGMLYGTTAAGGQSNQGTIFRLHQDGSGYAVLKSFTGLDGANPRSALMQASNGLLYGTTFAGGGHGLGTVFSIAPDGTDYLVRKNLGASTNEGANPGGTLVQGTNGMLYGTTQLGGPGGQGTIFQMDPETGDMQVLKSFSGIWPDLAQPWSGLLLGKDGLLYGTTRLGGQYRLGTIFSITHDGSDFRILHAFILSSGAYPAAALIQDTNGFLYGTTQGGGTSTNGVIFQLDPEHGGLRVLHKFAPLDIFPSGAVLLGSDGSLYGMTALGGTGMFGEGSAKGTAFRLEYNGTVYTNYSRIWSFDVAGGDGVNPESALLEATNGCLYGTTREGGAYGQGTVFKINRDGTDYAILRSLTGSAGDGANPAAPLIQALDGRLYGVTRWSGGGIVFRINLDGSDFEAITNSSVIEASAGISQVEGVLYGVRNWVPDGLFKMNLDGGGFAVAVPFTSLRGMFYTPLVVGGDGTLYGTTVSSGSIGASLFRVDPSAGSFQVLKQLDSISGIEPGDWLRVTQGYDGMLYGAGRDGPAPTWLFRLRPDGTGYVKLHEFGRYPSAEERYPIASPIQARNGLLYGTAAHAGGLDFLGAVYQLFPDGTGYSVLKRFRTNDVNEVFWPGDIIEGSDGALYGIAPRRSGSMGGIFRLEPPPVLLPPIVTATSVRIPVLGTAGRSCRLERTESLPGSWSVAGTSLIGPNGAAEFEDSIPLTAGFYRASYD